MKLVTTPITLAELDKMSNRMFGGLVKAVVDIKKEIMIVDAALHADEEAELLNDGSNQEDLWGINLYPQITGDDFVEFDSMINIRPGLKNFSRDVENKEIRQKILEIVSKLISK